VCLAGGYVERLDGRRAPGRDTDARAAGLAKTLRTGASAISGRDFEHRLGGFGVIVVIGLLIVFPLLLLLILLLLIFLVLFCLLAFF
jgi:hypothetical protein